MNSYKKWNNRFIKLAYEVATWSKDPNAQVGAVAVSPDKLNFTLGYNGFPRHIEDDDRLTCSELKLPLMVHAEMNAILNAPVRPVKWSLYVTRMPCRNCALHIIQSGISRVFVPPINLESKWAAEQLKAEDIMIEAKIAINLLTNEELANVRC